MAGSFSFRQGEAPYKLWLTGGFAWFYRPNSRASIVTMTIFTTVRARSQMNKYFIWILSVRVRSQKRRTGHKILPFGDILWFTRREVTHRSNFPIRRSPECPTKPPAATGGFVFHWARQSHTYLPAIKFSHACMTHSVWGMRNLENSHLYAH